MLNPASLLRSRSVIAANPFVLLMVSAALKIFTRFLTATSSFLIRMLFRLPRKSSLQRSSMERLTIRLKDPNWRSVSISDQVDVVLWLKIGGGEELVKAFERALVFQAFREALTCPAFRSASPLATYPVFEELLMPRKREEHREHHSYSQDP
jgi:hypothetical protein